ncbi:MAG: hypothetical protein M3Q05_04000, partial [Bacteroidota bacterium]|nr:hypothetical protein [Bacteroidota bacterium]
GLENVSTYDLARALQIRQSNITYYFPTKSHIINALGKRMVAEVDQPFGAFEPSEFSFTFFYRLVDRVMQVHLRYRFLMLNYASIIIADRELNDYFVHVLEGRFAQFGGIIMMLDANGYVRGEEMLPHSRNLLLMQNMIIIYWVQEGAIYNADKTDEEKRRHYAKLFFQVFVPYLTPKGEENLKPFM